MLRYFARFIQDIKKYPQFILYSVKSNLKAELSNTIMGYLWWLLDPLLNMIVYTFLVQVIFKRSTPAFPVYVFCALLPWKVATSTMAQSTKCIRMNASVIKQIYIPKFTLPLITLMTNLIKLLFGLIILIVMMLFFKVPFTWHIIEFIPVMLVFSLFYYSISLFFTHLGVLFDDMSHLIGYLLMFWFYTSPAIWSLDLLPESMRGIIWINPNVTFFLSIRNALMYGQSPYYGLLGVWLLVSIVFLFFGIPLLYRADKNYGKVI